MKKILKLVLTFACFFPLLTGCKKDNIQYLNGQYSAYKNGELLNLFSEIISFHDDQELNGGKIYGVIGSHSLDIYYDNYDKSNRDLIIGSTQSEDLLDIRSAHYLALGTLSIDDFNIFKKHCELIAISDISVYENRGTKEENCIQFVFFQFRDFSSAINYRRWEFSEFKDYSCFISNNCLIYPLATSNGIKNSDVCYYNVDGKFVSAAMTVSSDSIISALKDIIEYVKADR